MLYLDDFLEKLELLPQEIINQTSEIRQLDQQVKDSMDCVKRNVDNLFSNANTMHPDDLYADFNTVMKVGDKALKQSDDKIQIANNMQKLVGRYINHIDIELQKFKRDLDVVKSGTTELIEKKIEKVFNNGISFEEQLTADSHLSGTGGLELQIDAVPTNSQMDLYPLSYASEHIGATSSDISAAASKTKVNTKKKIKGCKRANLKVSTVRIKCNKTSSVSVALLPEQPIDRQLSQSGGSNKNQTKKRTKNVEPEETKRNDFIDIMTTDDDKIDEYHNLRYCICNEVAYGEMIACDNRKCPREWFHYSCVGIQSAPTGKWYCLDCASKMKKRRR
ncbi:inhibitor of growth protein 3-like [Myzus persicae]|uniref:inhibitor of growth protein 3-like n=1 Tax=Myzus persicae TaxID=13164 RepID=UPI000B936206|nr:inhibitor of growth protein 3-like [Myzus persicae]